MVQKEKELLLKDLCCRLPYGIKIKTSYDKMNEPIELRFINPKNESFAIGSNFTLISGLDFDTYECKPYLFPMSSMTEEQKDELNKCIKQDYQKEYDNFINNISNGVMKSIPMPNGNVMEFYHKHHLDYRGLIPMELAIDATNLNIY